MNANTKAVLCLVTLLVLVLLTVGGMGWVGWYATQPGNAPAMLGVPVIAALGYGFYQDGCREMSGY